MQDLNSCTYELRTERLRLRRWNEQDRARFAALNAEPIVMEFFPAMLSRTESDIFEYRIANPLCPHVLYRLQRPTYKEVPHV